MAEVIEFNESLGRKGIRVMESEGSMEKITPHMVLHKHVDGVDT